MSEQFIPRKHVEKLSGLARSTIYRKIKDGSFPRPVSIGGNAVRWKLSDIVDWQNSCEEKDAVA
jgi:prophage regulatory protein